MIKRNAQEASWSRQRGKRLRCGVLFAFIALLSQSIVSLLPMPAEAMSAVDLKSDRLFSAVYAFCQPAHAEAGKILPKPGKSPLHNMAQCPVCQAFHLMGSLVPPTPIAVAYPRCLGPPSLASAANLEPHLHLASAHRARGPPPLV